MSVDDVDFSVCVESSLEVVGLPWTSESIEASIDFKKFSEKRTGKGLEDSIEEPDEENLKPIRAVDDLIEGSVERAPCPEWISASSFEIKDCGLTLTTGPASPQSVSSLISGCFTDVSAPREGWKLASVENKGMGLVATRTFTEGETILEEKPIIKLSIPQPCNREELIHVYEKAFKQLPADSQSALWGLADNASFPKSVSGIIDTNGSYVLDHPEFNSVVCLSSSFLNHSCSPNASKYFSRKDGVMRVVANRTINPEEEICSCYDPWSTQGDRAHRFLMLSQNFRFECGCRDCLTPPPPGEISALDNKRKHATILRDSVREFDLNALKVYLEIMDLCEQSGMCKDHVCEVCMNCLELALHVGEPTLEILERAARLSFASRGSMSMRTKSLQKWLEEIKEGGKTLEEVAVTWPLERD